MGRRVGWRSAVACLAIVAMVVPVYGAGAEATGADAAPTVGGTTPSAPNPATESRDVADRALADADSGLGTNLRGLVDWSDEDPFVDRMKLSREWIPQCTPGTDPGCTNATAFDTGEQDLIETDADGWVTRLPARSDAPVFTRVSTLLMVAGEGPHNDYAGRYVVTYSGSGTLAYSLGASAVSSTPGRDIIAIDSSGFALLSITATEPTNPLRDIVVVREDQESLLVTQRSRFVRCGIRCARSSLDSQPFSPTWLDRLQPFRILRFMDWMRTNGSRNETPADLPTTTDARWTTDAGAPAEIMAAAANAVQAEPWFTVPHRATDAYVTALATAVHRALSPNLRVYVEFSNEVWNSGFAQAGEIEQFAAAEFAGQSGSAFTKRMNWHGMRTAQVCHLWRDVFGADAGRITCVLGAQAANSFTATEALDCPLWRADPDNPRPALTCQQQGIDAIAIAPYVGSYLGDPAFADQTRGLTLDQLFTELLGGGVLTDPDPGDWSRVPPGGALAESREWMDDYDALAAQRGLRVLAYEGGQHLVGVGAAQGDQQLTDLLVAANRDPRMGEVYRRHLADWRAAPNGRRDAYVLFSLAGRYGQYGSWGLLEHIEQASSPKYDAAVAASTIACWWPACRVTQDPAAATSGGSNPGTGTPDPPANPAAGTATRRPQRPVPRLDLPDRLRPRGTTRVVSLPITTNAGQRARVTVTCRVRGERRDGGCGRAFDVRRTRSTLAVRLAATRPLVVRLTIRAGAVPGFAPLNRTRGYGIRPGR